VAPNKKIPGDVVREVIRLDAAMVGTQAEIAARFGIARQTVCKILHRHNQQVGEELVKRHAEIKGRQLGRLEHVALEAMKGWEASKKPTRRTKRRITEGGKGGGEEMREKTITRGPGDPRFLAEARGALADARRVAGLDSDQRDDGDVPAAGSAEVTEALQTIARMQQERKLGLVGADDDQGQGDQDQGPGDGGPGDRDGGGGPPDRSPGGGGQSGGPAGSVAPWLYT
jgi:hypothetical protein